MDAIFDKIVAVTNNFFGVIRLVVIVLISLSGLIAIVAGSLGGLFGAISMLIVSVMFFEIYRVICLKDKKVSVEMPEIRKPE